MRHSTAQLQKQGNKGLDHFDVMTAIEHSLVGIENAIDLLNIYEERASRTDLPQEDLQSYSCLIHSANNSLIEERQNLKEFCRMLHNED
jgi:hypothetical protein